MSDDVGIKADLNSLYFPTLNQGAEEIHAMELSLNQYAAKVAKGHCADFIGYSNVGEDEARGSSLSPGLWLVRNRGGLCYCIDKEQA